MGVPGSPSAALAGTFDVVLACDVLYEKAFIEPLAGVVARLLKPSGGVLLLADPPDRCV